MRIICSNCNTGQDFALETKSDNKNPVIKCKACDKKIKIQFCPHCSAFYSVTFSNIKSGNYRYKCRKCGKNFVINFNHAAEESQSIEGTSTETENNMNTEFPHEQKPVEEHHLPGKKEEEKNENGVSPLSGKGINSFSLNEILRAMAGAFAWNKIAAASAGAALMLLLTRLFIFLSINIFTAPMPGTVQGTALTLFPMAIIFSFYLLTASVIAKITLKEVMAGEKIHTPGLVHFTCTAAPSVLLSNAILILAAASLFILFGKIPVLGPVLFGLIFLPVYTAGVVLTLLVIIGFWFYAPIAAHRDNGIKANLKNLILFIKKHNLNLIFIIPAMTLLSSIVFGGIYIIHTAALTLAVKLSGALLGNDSGVLLSTAPASVVKAAEPFLAGSGGSAFRGLYDSLTFSHTAGGIILGMSLFLLAVILSALFISVTATLSTQVYIMMERGIYMDDRRKAGVMIILAAAAASALLIKRLIF
jgi:DNA-directed RNA polymerase subunit RPC12/RpoP